MPYAPYINDNPYRLLGLASTATQSELLRAAELADASATIGIPPPSGLMQVFGIEMLHACLTRVHSLAGDPMERTICRLFWPFDYVRSAEFNGSLTDLLRLDILGAPPTFRTLHLRFVIRWVEYLNNPSALDVQEVLEAFDNLCKDPQIYDFLVELLINDGETPEIAKEIGYHAPTLLLERMLVVFSRQAPLWWERGNIKAVTTLIHNLTVAEYEESLIAKILTDLVASGDREADRIQTIMSAYQGWTPVQSPYDVREIESLHRLGMELKERIPAAQRWLKVIDDRLRQVAYVTRDQALALTADKNHYEIALQILAHLQTLPLPEDVAQQIREAVAQVRGLLEAREHAIWGHINRGADAPPLMTFRGIGTMIYGKTPFEGNPAWHYATLYFVIFYLPVIPIRRYLVSPLSLGSWNFYGSAPLSKYGKYHLWTSLSLIVLLAIYFAIPAASRPAFIQESESQRTPYSTDSYSTNSYGSTSPAESAPESSASKHERDQENEVARLRAELEAAKPGIDARRKEVRATRDRISKEYKAVNTNSRRSVNHYNADFDRYIKQAKQFNAEVAAYNKKTKQMNAIIKQLPSP